MRPAVCQLDARPDPVCCDQAVTSCIAVDLDDAAKATQYPFGMLSARPGAQRVALAEALADAV